MSNPKPVRLVKDGKVTEAVKPTTVTDLKSKGWKVEKPAAPAPKVEKPAEKKGDA